MRLVKTANGNCKVKMSKKEWSDLGKKAGWDDRPPSDSWSNFVVELNRLFAIVRSRTPQQLARRFESHSIHRENSKVPDALKIVNDFLDWSDEEEMHDLDYDWSYEEGVDRDYNKPDGYPGPSSNI